MENLFGPIKRLMKVNGGIIRCMGKVFSLGQTEEDTKGSILKIKSKDLGLFNGQMEESMKGNGSKEISMDKVSIKERTESGSLDIGKMEREPDEKSVL